MGKFLCIKLIVWEVVSIVQFMFRQYYKHEKGFSNYIVDCSSESCSSWLTSTTSCSKQKWHKKGLWNQSLGLGHSSKDLNFHERYGLFWSHECTLPVAGKVVSSAETPDTLWLGEQGHGSAAWAMKLSWWLHEMMSHSLASATQTSITVTWISGEANTMLTVPPCLNNSF